MDSLAKLTAAKPPKWGCAIDEIKADDGRLLCFAPGHFAIPCGDDHGSKGMVYLNAHEVRLESGAGKSRMTWDVTGLAEYEPGLETMEFGEAEIGDLALAESGTLLLRVHSGRYLDLQSGIISGAAHAEVTSVHFKRWSIIVPATLSRSKSELLEYRGPLPIVQLPDNGR